MRIHVYPRARFAIIGTENHENVELPPGDHGDFVEFDSSDVHHPLYASISHLIMEPEAPPEPPFCENEFAASRRGMCWSRSEVTPEGRRVNTFHFDHAGDVLPWHTHDASNVHTSEIASGSFDLRTESGTRVVSAGDPIIDWEPGQWHEFTAREPGGVLVNRVKRVEKP